MSIVAPRYETNSTTPGRLLSIPACGAASTMIRSGRSASVAGPAGAALAGERQAARRSGTGPGASTAPSMKLERPTNAGDEPVGRALVEVLLRAHLPHGAVAHHHQPVGHGQRLLLVVRHHDRREPELALQLADLDAHLLAQLGVEVRERLVEQQHIGPEDERASQRDALLLAARELARQALAQLLEAHEAQGLVDAAARSRPCRSLRISSPNATFCATVRCGNSA